MADTAPSLILTDSPKTSPLPKRGVALPSWVAIGAVAILLLALFGPLFIPVEASWRSDPNYSHGYLIPFICLGLAIRSWNRAGQPPKGDFRFALLSLVPGGFLLLAATVVHWPLITFGALALVLRGIAIAIGGRAWAAHFVAPILFTFFMFPVPVTWTSYLALWLQDMVSWICAGIMDPLVICWRTGTLLNIVGVPEPLNVGEECSGLRQLVGFIALAFLLGILLDRPLWIRFLLVLLAIPCAVFANVVRVLLMCYGALHYGTAWMDGWLHHAPAAFTIPVGFGLLAAADYLLGRLQQGASPPPSTTFSAETIDSRSLAKRLRPVAICLAIGFLAQLTLKSHLRATVSQSFPTATGSLAELPMVIEPRDSSAWVGQDRPGLAELRNRLPYAVDDILLRDYRAGEYGPTAQIYVVYSHQGDDRKHHPEICIREVSGAPEELGLRAKISLDAEHKRQVQRFVFRTGMAGRTTVYYWHYTFFAPARANSFLQTLYQRLGQTPPSVTVQVSTSSSEPDDINRIEADLLPAIDRALTEKFVPATAVIDATRLPVALLRE